MKPVLSLLLVMLLAGCGPYAQSVRPAGNGDAAAQEQAAPVEPVEPAPPPEVKLPNVELTPNLLYRLLLAEIAAQRGFTADAASLQLDIARETRDPRIARRAAETGLHGRRIDIALEAARIWRDTDTASPQARQTLISLLAAEGRYDELGSAIAGLLAEEPQYLAQNLSHLNRLFSRAPDRPAVRRLVETVTEPYLGMAEAHYARAVAAHEMRDSAAAQAAIGRAREIRPDWEAAALAQSQITTDRAAALAELGRFVAANPDTRDARLTYARLLVAEKRYEDARRQFRSLLDQGGGAGARGGDIVFAVAILSLQLGDTADAERLLRQLVDSGHAEADKARLHLGQIAADGKRWDEARQWFAQVGAGEHFIPARLQAAQTFVKQGQPDAAQRLLAETRQANPHENLRLLLGEAQLLRDQERSAEAYGLLADALKTQPDQPELLYETALLAEKLGRLDELETRLRRLIALQPDHAHAHNALGYSLADRSLRLDEARALIARALELAPDDPFIIDSQGWLLFRMGDKEGALAQLERAASIRPDPEIAAHLGEVLWALGRQDEARAVWEKARREHPANKVLTETIERFKR